MRQTFLCSTLVEREGLVSLPFRFSPKSSQLHNEKEEVLVSQIYWMVFVRKTDKNLLSQLKIKPVALQL